jgi:hypothetical protein
MVCNQCNVAAYIIIHERLQTCIIKIFPDFLRQNFYDRCISHDFLGRNFLRPVMKPDSKLIGAFYLLFHYHNLHKLWLINIFF